MDEAVAAKRNHRVKAIRLTCDFRRMARSLRFTHFNMRLTQLGTQRGNRLTRRLLRTAVLRNRIHYDEHAPSLA